MCLIPLKWYNNNSPTRGIQSRWFTATCLVSTLCKSCMLCTQHASLAAAATAVGGDILLVAGLTCNFWLLTQANRAKQCLSSHICNSTSDGLENVFVIRCKKYWVSIRPSLSVFFCCLFWDLLSLYYYTG